MINCCICHEKHHINNVTICNNFLTIMLKNYLNLNVNEYRKEFINYRSNCKRYNYSCRYCNKVMTSSTNYKYHMDNNVCKKKKNF